MRRRKQPRKRTKVIILLTVTIVQKKRARTTRTGILEEWGPLGMKVKTLDLLLLVRGAFTINMNHTITEWDLIHINFDTDYSNSSITGLCFEYKYAKQLYWHIVLFFYIFLDLNIIVIFIPDYLLQGSVPTIPIGTFLCSPLFTNGSHNLF